MNKNPTILITGCSSGIGLATAVYLSQKGFHVIATMRNLAKREKLDKALKEAHVSAEVLALDVNNKDSIQKVLTHIQANFGHLDALLNNAGFTIDGFLEDCTDADVRRIFETNFFGVLEVTRQVLPFMRSQKSGRILTIGSIAGQFALPQIGIYSAIKFALEGWTEALRFEVAPFGIKVSIIEPCFIQTELGGANRQVGELSNDPKSPYTPFNEAFDQFYEAYDHKYSKSPRAVAELIYKALMAKNPKIRYMLGSREKFFHLCKRLLPQMWFDRLYQRTFPKMLPNNS